MHQKLKEVQEKHESVRLAKQMEESMGLNKDKQDQKKAQGLMNSGIS